VLLTSQRPGGGGREFTLTSSDCGALPVPATTSDSSRGTPTVDGRLRKGASPHPGPGSCRGWPAVRSEPSQISYDAADRTHRQESRALNPGILLVFRFRFSGSAMASGPVHFCRQRSFSATVSPSLECLLSGKVAGSATRTKWLTLRQPTTVESIQRNYNVDCLDRGASGTDGRRTSGQTYVQLAGQPGAHLGGRPGDRVRFFPLRQSTRQR